VAESYSDQLKSGLLLASIEQTTKEPENYVLGRISHQALFLQKRSQYAHEVGRVIDELRMTVSLMEHIPGNFQIQDLSAKEETLLLYFQGIFFDLTHQLKDKLLQLIHLLTFDTVPDTPYEGKDVSLADLLRRRHEKLKAYELEQLLRLWGQDSTSGIGVVLRKRTIYHHRVSSLPLTDLFQKVQFAGLMRQPHLESYLTEYGKEEMEKLEQESRESLKVDVLQKARKTLAEIEENLNSISKAFVTNMDLAASEEKIKSTLSAYIQMLTSLQIKNVSSLQRIPPDIQSKFEKGVDQIKAAFSDHLVSMYLVGSLGRGEYIDGISDINIYVIVSDDCTANLDLDEQFTVLKFSPERFLSEAGKRYRFISWADGVLIAGKDLLGIEEFPKPGLDLALLLNDDFVEDVQSWEQWIRDNPQASSSEISRQSKIMAKGMLNFVYGVAIANKPTFTSSRKERVEKINEMFPGDNERVIGTLLRIIQHGVGRLADLSNMITGFKRKAFENLQKMKSAQLQFLEDTAQQKKK
jgi:predicted nucleotidyltransferase